MLRDLSPEQVARLTRVDFEREMAFIAVREATGETVGVARLVREPHDGHGEFAILMKTAIEGRGMRAGSALSCTGDPRSRRCRGFGRRCDADRLVR